MHEPATSKYLLVNLWLMTLMAGVSQIRGAAYQWSEDPDQSLVLRVQDRPIARYQFAHDPSTQQSRQQTYKPFLHLVDPITERTITKGPGGQFTHHRGLFIGWNRVKVGANRYDFWHMSQCNQIHTAFLLKEISSRGATVSSQIDWVPEGKPPVVREVRTMHLAEGNEPETMSIIDLTSRITALEALELGGDPEHAGIQLRPANEVDPTKTSFLFPEADQDPRKDLDLPWVAEEISLDTSTYTLIHMNHPANPTPTRYSAYRDYGRFGAFFTAALEAGQTLEVKYRILAIRAKMPHRAQIEAHYQHWLNP